MKKYRSTYLLIAMLLVLAMIMAACGGDDDNGDDENGDDTDPTPTVEVVATEEVDGLGATEEAGDMGATEEADAGGTGAATEESGDMGATEEADASGTGGDATNGETLFTSLGCVGCHGAEDASGPTLQGVATRAGERVEGMSAEEYLHQSLVEPEAYVVEGFEPIMPSYAEQPEDVLNDLVAYLMTLE